MAAQGYVKTGENGILVNAIEGDKIVVEKNNKEVTITYDTEPHFYMALARSMGMKNGKHVIESKIKDLGLMLDCSRNAVAKPSTVKSLICMLVMSGYNYMQLYTEETYELPDEPYFGYKRGRYTAEELKEIVAFADIFRFEMVPCIQTLAHLKNLSSWFVYYDHMDTEDTLLVGDERTYDLIRKSLRFSKEIFHTNRINIGSDEAFILGRGKYIDRYGYKSKHQIYLDHLKVIFEICKEEGFEPEFWADAFYDTDRATEDIQAIFDGTQTPVYWEYSITEKEPHVEKLNKLKEYAGKVMYAGGLWKWIGYAPDNRLSEQVIDAAFAAVEECGVDNVLMTAWGDNGDECSPFAILPSMWYSAQKLYPCDVDVDKVLKLLTGYTYDEWKVCDSLNFVEPELNKSSNAAKYLLYNDYLIGLVNYHIPPHAGEVYKKLYPTFKRLAKKDSAFAYIFEAYEALAKALIQKATFSNRLHDAYQAKDFQAMKELLGELKSIKKDLQKFYEAYRVLWMEENKGYGFEVMDVRIGGLITRADTVAILLKEYIDGKIEKIYELEDASIPYWPHVYLNEDKYSPVHNCWATAYSVNHF